MSALVDSRLIDVAVGVTRGWTALYTWRLPDNVREGRRAEIESDLWEHRHLAMLGDGSVYATALGIILRFLLGLPADLAWRVEVRSAHRSESEPDVRSYEPGYLRWAIRGAYSIIGFAALIGVLGVIVATATANVWYLPFAAMSLLTLAVTFWGLRISAKRQPLGILLVAGASLTFAFSWFWLIFVTLPIAVGLIALSYHRSKCAGWRSGTRSDAAP